jgi:hypothetical protein
MLSLNVCPVTEFIGVFGEPYSETAVIFLGDNGGELLEGLLLKVCCRFERTSANDGKSIKTDPLALGTPSEIESVLETVTHVSKGNFCPFIKVPFEDGFRPSPSMIWTSSPNLRKQA